ncbi:phosphoribosyl-ATP diphosphatase [Caenispirillum salinarum]|uniref:phosphoribosyl-ATP diphosphatase n=1 Tax=Caenispirillum salinarum TaxID=859058 RepID=UPI003851452F
MSNDASAAVLDELFSVIESRKTADPDSSYTAKLFAKGRKKIAQKVGEEGVECAIAAVSETPDDVVAESADLLYHLMVLWAEQGITPDRIYAELGKRVGVSGLTEKAARAKNGKPM